MSSHECPAPSCTVQVPRSQLACRNHWYALPIDMRREISRAYRNGEPDHLDLVLDAVAYLEARYPVPEQTR